MNNAVNEIINSIRTIYEKDIGIYNNAFLIDVINKRCKVLECKNIDEYSYILKKDYFEFMEFYNSLNINYSIFMRDPLTWSLLFHKILPNIINSISNNREIRLWSAGCSTGQEAYSLSLIMQEINYNNSCNFRYRVFATDIEEENLRVAKKGIYTIDDIGNVRTKHLFKYFNINNSTYSIKTELKKNVFFSVYDLLDNNKRHPIDSIYGDFDLIICSNILFYYNTDIQKNIVNKLNNALCKGGFLVTSDCEKFIIEQNSNMREVYFNIPIFQKNI